MFLLLRTCTYRTASSSGYASAKPKEGKAYSTVMSCRQWKRKQDRFKKRETERETESKRNGQGEREKRESTSVCSMVRCMTLAE